MPHDGAPPHTSQDTQAAFGRPVGVGGITYSAYAARLLDNGYEPLPIIPGAKRPPMKGWSGLAIDSDLVGRWSHCYPTHGIGLRTGQVVGLDIDYLDPDLAHLIDRAAQDRFGSTLTRVGLWPKRLLMYRTDRPFAKMAVGRVEILGAGQQFVGFGTHPDTGRPYHWPEGETPLEVSLRDLPPIDADRAAAFLGEIASLLPGTPRPGNRHSTRGDHPGPSGPTRNAEGRVIDGRDGWLSSLAFHSVHEALEAGEPLEADRIAARVWDRFLATSDVERAKQGGATAFSFADALRKVEDKLRLHREGLLPSRGTVPVQPTYALPTLGAPAARSALDGVLAEACAQIEAWHATEPKADASQLALRATVGLGKSVATRRHVLALRERLAAAGRPDRIAVFVPSHALAEETAAEFARAGAVVAVLRGYRAFHPVLGEPMCRDPEAVDAAILSGAEVQTSACASGEDKRCVFFASCLKQKNRAEVEAADIIVAPYDALFTGFATSPDRIALLVIDEGCWARAVADVDAGFAESFAALSGPAVGGWASKDSRTAAMADLLDLRRRAAAAFAGNGPGPLSRGHLNDAGLTAVACRSAIGLEQRRLQDPGLYPGMPKAARSHAVQLTRFNQQVQRSIEVWQALAELCDSEAERNGRIRLRDADGGTGLHALVVTGLRSLHPNLRAKPVLHLDATLRPNLAAAILPLLEITGIEATTPDMEVRLVVGSFGKSTLCPDPRADPAELARRQNRLGECVDYVRWHARRATPGRTLVVSYKDCETAFADIPGVEVAHFNAIAGLDAYRTVRTLIVIGRPLPPSGALAPLSGALFRHEPEGGYIHRRAGIHLRDGSVRAVRVIAHEDEMAEELRAAICDDELVQAIGRGRGVNRTAATPLEVHILADVALPLVHDRVLSWETECPDLLQRMLLAGVAVDSPGDAVLLHPDLFANPEQAKKALQRGVFGGQNPIRDIYREMSLKCAAYRRPGRGHGWQKAWWIERSAGAARTMLETALGVIVEWRIDDD